eukprot:6454834-Amphidinium_carterae.1
MGSKVSGTWVSCHDAAGGGSSTLKSASSMASGGSAAQEAAEPPEGVSRWVGGVPGGVPVPVTFGPGST